jgi:peptide/nickel transport system substrate-binding protein
MNRKYLIAAASLIALTGSAFAQTTLRIGLQEDPDVLDPHEARTFVGRIVFNNLCDKLLDTDAKLKFVPRIATEWSFGPDGKTLTMKLRPGLKFHDGEPLDAAAVKANIDRARTWAKSRRKSEIASVASVDAVDPTTVQFNLKSPDATLLAQLSDRAGMLISPKAMTDSFGARPICSGPFKFVERVQNDRIVLEKWKDHWEAEKYHIDRVVFRMIPDNTVRLANLRSGQLDMLERLAASDAKSVKSDRNLKLVSMTGIGYQGITINTGNGPAADTKLGKDKRVRQALSLLLDRDAISTVVFEGIDQPGNQPLPPASPYHADFLSPPARDVARAKALLKEAGIERFSFEMQVANNPVQQQLAQVIQAMAAEGGIDIKIKATEFASMLAEQSAGRFQATLVGWSGRVDPDGNMHQFVTTRGGINDGKFSNPEVDKILNEARTVYDQAARKKLYDAAQKILSSELPIIYTYFPVWLWATSTKLEGFTANPDGMIRLAGIRLAK